MHLMCFVFAVFLPGGGRRKPVSADEVISVGTARPLWVCPASPLDQLEDTTAELRRVQQGSWSGEEQLE